MATVGRFTTVANTSLTGQELTSSIDLRSGLRARVVTTRAVSNAKLLSPTDWANPPTVQFAWPAASAVPRRSR